MDHLQTGAPGMGVRRFGRINRLGLWTLILREIRRFTSVWSQTVAAPLITAGLFLAIFSLAVGPARGEVMGVGFAVFLAPGILMMTVVQNGAGIAVNALGHAHPALVAALTEQAGKLWHVSNLYQIPGSRRWPTSWSRRPSPIPSSSPIPAPKAANWRSRWRASTGHAGRPTGSRSSPSRAASTAAPPPPSPPPGRKR
jgi:hypothetical protein